MGLGSAVSTPRNEDAPITIDFSDGQFIHWRKGEVSKTSASPSNGGLRVGCTLVTAAAWKKLVDDEIARRAR